MNSTSQPVGRRGRIHARRRLNYMRPTAETLIAPLAVLEPIPVGDRNSDSRARSAPGGATGPDRDPRENKRSDRKRKDTEMLMTTRTYVLDEPEDCKGFPR
jgi:hypothetical protein